MILVARTAKALEEVEEQIHAAGGSATIAPLDLTDGESIGKLAAAAAERWQALDILVLNAAMLGSLSPVEHIDAKEYARVLTLNVVANQALIAAFDPMLRASERAEVVAVTSSVGKRAARLLGRLRLVQGGAREPRFVLRRRDRLFGQGAGPHPRPRRDPHPDARSSPFPARSPRASSRRRRSPTSSSSGCCPTRRAASGCGVDS